MLTIRKATTADCELIHKLAWQIFPETYKDILSPEQNDYMMEWMYSIENIRKQMEEEGHVYFIGYKDNEVCGYVSVQQLNFYERMGMRKLREGDFPIGNGYYMNDFIMGLEIN